MELKILDSRTDVIYATEGSAAFDLRACSASGEMLSEDVECVIPAGQVVLIGTGIALDLGAKFPMSMIGYCFAAHILPRSGLGCKGLVPGNLTGLIDSDYHGELKVCLWNRTSKDQVIHGLDRIAQCEIVPVFKPNFTIVKEFSRDTVRGANGFGSTGK